MYASRVACCPLVSHGEHADGTDKQTDGQTDGRQTVTLGFPLDVASLITYQQSKTSPKMPPLPICFWHLIILRLRSFSRFLELYKIVVSLCIYVYVDIINRISRYLTSHRDISDMTIPCISNSRQLPRPIQQLPARYSVGLTSRQLAWWARGSHAALYAVMFVNRSTSKTKPSTNKSSRQTSIN